MKWIEPVPVSINLEKEVKDFYTELAKDRRDSFNAIIEKTLEISMWEIQRDDQAEIELTNLQKEFDKSDEDIKGI